MRLVNMVVNHGPGHAAQTDIVNTSRLYPRAIGYSGEKSLFRTKRRLGEKSESSRRKNRSAPKTVTMAGDFRRATGTLHLQASRFVGTKRPSVAFGFSQTACRSTLGAVDMITDGEPL